jgi:hypothetical protein
MKIGAVAVAVAALFFVSDSTYAASKKSKASSQAESCTGGGCLGTEQNPNRTRPDYYSSYYKRSKSKKSSSKEQQ